jgi:hypothetical protein
MAHFHIYVGDMEEDRACATPRFVLVLLDFELPATTACILSVKKL